MAWWCIGNQPLPEPMMTQFTDAYASSNLNVFMAAMQ